MPSLAAASLFQQPGFQEFRGASSNGRRPKDHMSQFFCCGLVSVGTHSWGNDINAYVGGSNIHPSCPS